MVAAKSWPLHLETRRQCLVIFITAENWLTQPEFFDLIDFCFTKLIMYAVIETGGKQYQVAGGDQVEIERISAEEGSSVTFRVLMLRADGSVQVGTPTVETATVLADVVSHRRGPKVTTFKMKRRKGYHRTKGHRQNLTVIKIKKING